MSDAPLYRVLRSFAYSTNGVSVTDLCEGQTVPVRADLVDGLIRDGYIRLAHAQAATGALLPPPSGSAIGDVIREIRAILPGGDAYETKVAPAATPLEDEVHEAVQAEAGTEEVADLIDTMTRLELTAYLTSAGEKYFRGSPTDKLRAQARAVAAGK